MIKPIIEPNRSQYTYIHIWPKGMDERKIENGK